MTRIFASLIAAILIIAGHASAEMTDSGGSTVSRLSYDAFGNRTVVSGTNLPLSQFKGMIPATTVQVYLQGANFYDPGQGRRSSPVPTSGSSGYGWNDPAGTSPGQFLPPDPVSQGQAMFEDGRTSGGGGANWGNLSGAGAGCDPLANLGNNILNNAAAAIAQAGLQGYVDFASMLAAAMGLPEGEGLAAIEQEIAAKAGNEAFWFGPGAQEAATADGANILQLSSEASSALNAGNPSLMFQESANFAANASGDVSVYANAAANDTSAGYTFWNYEAPQLLSNPNVTSINYIFPK